MIVGAVGNRRKSQFSQFFVERFGVFDDLAAVFFKRRFCGFVKALGNGRSLVIVWSALKSRENGFIDFRSDVDFMAFCRQ